MNAEGLLVLVVMAIAIVGAWIGYAVASPDGKRRIQARRDARSKALIGRSPGSAAHAAATEHPSGVSEDSTYGG